MSSIDNQTYYLTGKIFIEGTIKAVTGLHIGGSKSALDIGGIDLAVIKTAKDKMPFIPGSSLKGKLRSMLALEGGYKKVDDDSPEIKRIFGYSADQGGTLGMPTKLIVRDADLMHESFNEDFKDEDLDFKYTEEKWENTIDRKTGTALHPRQIERVPAGAKFNLRMVYNVYIGKDKNKADTLEDLRLIRQAMRMLCDDYLGGHGSRGSGHIAFEGVRAFIRSMEDYKLETVGETKLTDSFLDSAISGEFIPVTNGIEPTP